MTTEIPRQEEIQRIRPLLDQMSNGVLILDRDHQVVVFNRALAQLTEVSPEQALGKPSESLNIRLTVGGRPVGPGISLPNECLCTPDSCFSRRYQLHRTDGSERCIQLRFRPMFCPDGLCHYFVGVVRDITAEDQLERARQRSRRMESLDTVGYELAHQLMGPLSSIDIQVQLLSRMAGKIEESPAGDMASGLGLIRAEVERLRAMVTDTMQLQKPERRTLTSTAPRDLLHELAMLVRNRAEDQGVELTVDCAEDLPRFRVDSGRLQAALLQLAMNALEVMPDGGNLRLLARRHEDVIRLTIADDGPGIPNEILRNAFELFYTTKSGGTGLGLPLARSILEEHGGTLRIIDAEVGAEFEASLPIT